MNWERVKRYGQRAGKEILCLAEATFITMKDPQVSWKQKTLLMAALAYLLSPVDAIPDLLPGGYVDDMSLLLTTLLGVGSVGKKHLHDCRKKHGLVESPELDSDSKTSSKNKGSTDEFE